jgi:cytoskeletal protein CcmA (bactofilin family)
MAVQTPFFGKQRDADAFGARQPASHGASTGLAAAGALPAASPAAAPQPTGGGQAAPAGAREGGSKLTVGPNIKLKGVEITDCDTLVVEGLVEATMDSRLMQIAQQGAFKGSAEIDIAEIHGEFDGSLTVRQKLVIHATGKVTGKIRYGKVVIEEGGQLSGEIEFGTAGAAKGPAPTRPGSQVAAA